MKWWRDPRQRLGAVCAIVAVLVIVGLINKGHGDNTKSAAAAGLSTPAPDTPTAAPGATGPSTATVGKTSGGVPAKPSGKPGHVLPDLVGVNYQQAWDGARRAGYRFVTSHDASGRERRQFLYSSWKVCDQKPGPGPLATGTPVDLGVVRHDEKCPAGSVPTVEPKVVDGRLPDLVGRSVNVVREALRGDAHVDADDLLGDRAVLVETHWVVCTQRPGAGAAVPETVKVGVVRYGENCP